MAKKRRSKRPKAKGTPATDTSAPADVNDEAAADDEAAEDESSATASGSDATGPAAGATQGDDANAKAGDARHATANDATGAKRDRVIDGLAADAKLEGDDAHSKADDGHPKADDAAGPKAKRDRVIDDLAADAKLVGDDALSKADDGHPKADDAAAKRDRAIDGLAADAKVGKHEKRDAGRDAKRDAGRDARRDAGRDANRSRDAGRDAKRDDRHAGRDAKRDASRDDVGRAAAPEVIRAGTPTAWKSPMFWFGFEVAWAKLAVSRFVLFTLLALDALLQISHAPRYGAGGFNVANLGFLDDLGPGRVAYGTCQLVLAYAFVLIAFGVATRVLVPISAAIYAWLYFGSQLDSYQHHYLIALVLAIASFVPWQRPEGAAPDTKVRSWAVRLILVQLAIMYVWAAISKMNTAWVDGTTLSTQITGDFADLIKATIGFKVMAVLVIATELALAVTIWTRPSWIIAAPLGLAFHLGIAATGLEIGLFAYLMLGIYALVIPDVLWINVMRGPLHRLGTRLQQPGWVMWGVGLAIAVGLAALVRIEGAFMVAVALAIVPLASAVFAVAKSAAKKPIAAVGAAHVVAIALWLFVDRTSSVVVDYYRFWGGSQRRIGTPEGAEHAYRRLTEVAPDDAGGHYQLGKLLLKRGVLERSGSAAPPSAAERRGDAIERSGSAGPRSAEERRGDVIERSGSAGPRSAEERRGDVIDEGLEHLHAAQRLEPAKARAFVEEARYLQQAGKVPEAIEKAKQATYADPSDTAARNLLDALVKGKAKPVADPPEPDTD